MKLATIYQSLKSLQIFYELGKSFNLLTKVKRVLNKIYSVDRLSDEYFEGNLGFGDKIIVEGTLSKYGYMYKPKAYPGFISQPSRFKRKLPKGVNSSFETKLSICQQPVQKINSFQGDSGTYNICFLYPSSFDSFIMDLDENGKNENVPIEELQLRVEPKHKPIIIILSEDQTNKYSERKVKLEGIIRKIPTDISDELQNNFDKFRKQVYSNTFRPFSERIGFCVDCRGKENLIENIQNLTKLEGYVYIESHISGKEFDVEDGFFNDIIPSSLSPKFIIPIILGENNSTASFTGQENVRITMHKDYIFGFFAKLDLKNDRFTNYHLKELIAKYKKFEKATNDKLKKHKISATVELDFIFDSERTKLIETNLLQSDEIDEIIEKEASLTELINWLQGD